MSALRLRCDLELYQAAVDLARQRARWRERAAAGGTPHETRRKCQLHARYLASRIVDIAIQAELRCRGRS